MDASAREIVRHLASKYIWWKSLEDAAATPDRVAAQVMNVGDYDDVQALVAAVGDDYLRNVLRQAEAGQFDARAWTLVALSIDSRRARRRPAAAGAPNGLMSRLQRTQGGHDRTRSHLVRRAGLGRSTTILVWSRHGDRRRNCPQSRLEFPCCWK